MAFRDDVFRVGSYFSRKFVLAVLALVSGLYLQFHGHDLEGYAILAGIVLTAYNGANVAETFASVKHKLGSVQHQPTPTTVDVKVDTGT